MNLDSSTHQLPLARTAGRRVQSVSWVRSLLLAAAFAVGTGLLAQVRLYLPFTPVPVTGQTLGVLLSGAVLGARRGSLAMLAYVVLGIAGVPWFAGGESGSVAYLLGPTGGYLVAFPLAAWLVGAAQDRFGWACRWRGQLAVMALAMLLVYSLGASWLAVSLRKTWAEAIALGVLPFVAGDALKVALAATAGSLLAPRHCSSRAPHESPRRDTGLSTEDGHQDP